MLRYLLLPIFSLCTFLLMAQVYKFSNPVKFLGSLNTEADETFPVVLNDSSGVYFVRTFSKLNKGGYMDEDIWYSPMSRYGEAKPAVPVKGLNTKFNNSVVSVSKDGKTVFLLDTYDGKKDMKKGLAQSNFDGKKWSKPTKVNIPNLDIDGDFYTFHVTEDQQVILISYKGPGSVGEEDIYCAVRTGSSWSEPIHLGTTINTSSFETSPYLNYGKDTLFFSSNGHGGYGDADIFYSVRKDSSWTSWSEPVNLGEVINSPKFDAYFSKNGMRAYWSSNKDGEFGDLYMARCVVPEPLEITLSSTDCSKYKLYDGTTDLTIKGGVAPYIITWSNGSSREDLDSLQPGDYLVTVVDARGISKEANVVIAEPGPIELPEVKKVDYLALELINYFEYNKNKIHVRKAGKLNKFYKDLDDQLEKGRAEVTIKIHSSASKVPTRKFKSNEELSSLRAENLKYDLTDHFSKKKYKDLKVTIVIVSSNVEGPDYSGDRNDHDKYYPYQFVALTTE